MRYALSWLAAICLIAMPAASSELKVATWNLNWLTARPAGDPALPADVQPRPAHAFEMLRGYAAALDADVIAFQEVDGPGVASRVFPPDRYTILTTDDNVVQRVGFAVRRGLQAHRNPDLVGLDVVPDAVHHLRSGADITLDLPSGPLRLLTIHLKTGCNMDGLARSLRRECDTLRRQLPPLQGWIAQRRQEHAAFILLGDFNRRMDGRDDVLDALQAAAPLARATEGHADPCWGGGSFIDHIFAGGAARGWMEPATLRVLVYRESDPAVKDQLSDHCPVSVRFRLPG